VEIFSPKGGFFRLFSRTVSREDFDRKWVCKSGPWYVLERDPSVAVLIHDPDTDQVVLVEQFRPTVLHTTIEIPSGGVKADENPLETVKREVLEETGLIIDNLLLVEEILVSPGITTEMITIYYSTLHGLGKSGTLHGLAKEGECTKKHAVLFSEAIYLIESRVISDAKTIMALRWLQIKKLQDALK
jgi:ADP-ribose pyrophosphatase